MKTIRLQAGNIRIFFLPLCASFTFSPYGHADEYYFDPSLFKGSAFGQNIDQFNHQTIAPATIMSISMLTISWLKAASP